MELLLILAVFPGIVLALRSPKSVIFVVWFLYLFNTKIAFLYNTNLMQWSAYPLIWSNFRAKIPDNFLIHKPCLIRAGNYTISTAAAFILVD